MILCGDVDVKHRGREQSFCRTRMVAEQDLKQAALETSGKAETDCNSFVAVRGLTREVATVRVEYIRLRNSLCRSSDLVEYKLYPEV